MKKQLLKQITMSLMLMVLQYLTFYPVLIAIGLGVFDQLIIGCLWILPLCSWIGFGIFLYFQKVPIALTRLILLSIALVISSMLFQTGGQRAIATVMLAVFFVIPSYEIDGLFNQTTALANNLLGIGLMLYLFVGFFGQVAQMEQLQHSLIMPSILFIILSLFLSNDYTIQEAVRREGKQPTISKAVIRQNRMMVAGVLVAVLLVVGFNWLKQAVFGLIHQISTSVMGLIQWLSSLFGHKEVVEESVQKGVRPNMDILEPAGEPALIWIILEKVMFVVAAVIIISLIYLFIKKKFPKFLKWLKRLMSERQAFKTNQSSVEYSEEQESIFHTQKILSSIKKAWGNRRVKRFNERWTDAKNEKEKARFLYRYYLYQQVTKGIKPQLSQTAKEILAQDCNKEMDIEIKQALEELYEQARYGAVTDIDEQQLKILKGKMMVLK